MCARWRASIYINYCIERSWSGSNQRAIFVKTAPMLLEQTGRVLLTRACSVCWEEKAAGRFYLNLPLKWEP